MAEKDIERFLVNGVKKLGGFGLIRMMPVLRGTWKISSILPAKIKLTARCSWYPKATKSTR